MTVIQMNYTKTICFGGETTNQLRAGLASETFVYWRTLYETLVKSRFMLKFSKADADLLGRFMYYTNSKYLKFYSMFAPEDDPHMIIRKVFQ